MPDAFENFNMAMLSANITEDDPYLVLNGLAPMDNTNILSPYSSSGSQGNMSATSPMSISSSPQHLTDYITLSNATAVGEPHIAILVQPMEKFRFRYRSEMMGTHGTLLGIANGSSRKKHVPTVQLRNFVDKAIIRCSLVTTDEDERVLHAHRLVRRRDNTDEDDPHHVDVSSHNDFTATFTGMGIIHTARKYIKDELVRKMREQLREERKRANINATISVRDDAQIKADAECYQKSMNLNSVALCFQAFILNEHNIPVPITAPVYSSPVNNLKSALTGELKICRIDKHTSSCEGGEEVFIFVEKVGKKNIKIKFFELNDDDREIWCDYGRFSELDVHHQYAIVFRTPPYKDMTITCAREVFIQLERPSDSDCSEPIKFTYKPSDRMMGRKRTRISHSSSVELAQMVSNQNISLSDIHITSNESTEMSKEIKKILDDRCSSGEFRNFVEHMDLDSYVNLLSNSEDCKLTCDGPPIRKQEDDKLFAKNIVINALKSMEAEPDKAKRKDIVKSFLKDRSTYGDSPLHSALRYGQKDIVKYIFMLMTTISNPKKLVNIQNSSGKTPLHYAVTQNQPEVTRALLLLGADPNLSDHGGQMSLHAAVKFEESGECVDILLAEKGINLEAHTDLGWTPLQLAAEAGSYYAVQSLIKAGADVDNTDMSYGRTALHIAVEGGHKDIVEFLLKKTDINVNKKNFSGNTALHSAVVTPGAIAEEMCTLLVKYGASPIKDVNREPSNEGREDLQSIKTEMDSEDENMEECGGQSSFDLALNKPGILQLASDKHDVLLEEIHAIKKEENIDDTQRVWLDTEQEKQLSNILDKTKGWEKLIDYFGFRYLLKTLQQSSSSPTLLLLNYIDIKSETSLNDLHKVLQVIGEEDAAMYMGQILAECS